MWRLTGLVVAGLLVVGCSSGGEADAGAKLACRDFRSTAQDQTDGLLTPDELRSRIQDVHDNARLSEEPGIADAGRELLAEATAAGDDINTQGYADAVTTFGTACEDLDL